MKHEAKQSYRALTFSILVHGTLLFIVALQISDGSTKKKALFELQIKEQPVISAQLIIPQKQIKKKARRKAPTQFNESAINPVEKPTIAEKLPVARKDKMTEVVPQKPTPSDIEKPTMVATTKDRQTKIIAKQVASTTPKSSVSAIAQSREYLRKQTIKAPIYREEAEYASMSVMDNNVVTHKYQYIEENIEEKRLVKITCDTTTKKVLAGLSGLLKGTLRCNPNPDLSPFIKQKPKPKFKYKLDQE